MRRSALIALFLLPVAAFAWDDTAHMTVAQIAYDRLTPKARQTVDRVLRQNPAPDFTDFVRSATYPDQLKRYGIKAYSAWHTIATPYVRDQVKTSEPRPDNAVWAIEQCTKALTDERTISYEKARMLRFLIHLVGDIHQPIHAATLFDKDHPDGDDNGREFKLGKGKKNRLHALWDTSFGVYHDLEDSRKADLSEIRRLADNVLSDTRGQKLGDATDLDPEDWAKESYRLAVDVAYRTTEGEAPSPAYIDRARKICRERIALAGQRLANLLNKALG